MRPSSYQRLQNRPRYPAVEAEIGEDPARFLWTRSTDGRDTGQGDSPELALAMARIRGIRSPATVQAWINVEADLDIGPRKHIIAALNRRKSALDEIDASDSTEEESATQSQGGVA